MDKDERRRRARRLPPATTGESAAIVATLAGLDELGPGTTACLFLPLPEEVDLRALPDRVQDVRWVTTRTGAGPDLTLHGLAAPRERHGFGFEQPVADAAQVPPHDVDVWLVPGLAFDVHGTRLGQGRGYYDRLLARRAEGSLVIGVTTNARIVPTLPCEDHDVPMDRLVTGDGLHTADRVA